MYQSAKCFLPDKWRWREINWNLIFTAELGAIDANLLIEMVNGGPGCIEACLNAVPNEEPKSIGLRSLIQKIMLSLCM